MPSRSMPLFPQSHDPHSAPSPVRPALGTAALLTVGLLLPAPAAASDLLAEEAFLGELPVVLSASRLAQPLRDTPGAVTVIDRDMIRVSGARSVDELLRWVPGFQVGQRSGFLPLTTYHGLSDEAPRRMLVRVDGRSIYTPYYVSGTEWHKLTLDLDDIERIEVFRGSNAAAYGSQAFMGVVNIVTRAAGEAPGFRLRVNQGDNGIQDRNASLSHRFARAGLRVSVGRDGDDGLDALADSWRRRRADLRFDHQLSTDQRLEIHAGATRLDGGVGRAGSLSNPERGLASDGEFAQLRWRWQPAADEELSLSYSHERNRLDDRYTIASIEAALARDFGFQPEAVAARLIALGVTPPGATLVDFDASAVRDDLEIQHTTSPGRDWRLVWGLGSRTDRIDSSAALMGKPEVVYRSERLFANLEWRTTPRWLVNGGVMVEDGSYVGTLVSPRLAVNYHLADDHTLRAAISRTHRRPTPFERSGNLRFLEQDTGVLLDQRNQAAPGLDAERLTVRELGYLAELRALQTTVDLRLFEEEARSLITFVDRPFPDPFDGVALQAGNNAHATVRGAELALNWRPARTTWLGLNHAYLDIDGSDPAFNHSAPRRAWSLLAAWAPRPEWQFGLAWHYVGSMGWYAAEADLLDSYQRADLRVARRFEAGPTRGELALVLQSIATHTADFRPAFSNGPRSFASLRLEF